LQDLLFAAALAATAPALAADVGTTVSSSQPVFYGRLNISDYPPPQVIDLQPLAIERVPIDRPPIYLRVPPGHAKNWRKHCHQYKACGERVLFVQDKWYSREHVPRHKKPHPERLVNDRRSDDHARNQAY